MNLKDSFFKFTPTVTVRFGTSLLILQLLLGYCLTILLMLDSISDGLAFNALEMSVGKDTKRKLLQSFVRSVYIQYYNIDDFELRIGTAESGLVQLTQFGGCDQIVGKEVCNLRSN